MEIARKQSIEQQGSPAREEFLTEIRWQAENFPTGDEIGSAFCVAAEEMMAENLEFSNLVDTFIDEQPDHTPSYRLNILWHSLQKQLLRRVRDSDAPYPGAYNEPAQWKKAIAAVSVPYSEENEEFYFDINYRHLQSNVAERYKAFALIMQLSGERLFEPAKILDVGCSQNLGLKKLALTNLGTHFNDIEVIEFGDTDSEIIVNKELSEHMNSLLRGRLAIGDSVGVDMVQSDDARNKEWAKACSFYPKELMMPERVEEYDYLDAANPPNVDFLWEDFSEIDTEQLEAQYDIVTFSTMLYQSDRSAQAKMLSNALRCVKPGGIVIVQDFLSSDSKNQDQLYFSKSWFKHLYGYRTLLLDSQDPTRFHEIFRWENGRCKRMLPGRDIGILGITL